MKFPIHYGAKPASVEPNRHTYFFGPFRLVSDLVISPLEQVRGSGRIPVSVELGPVPETIPGAEVLDRCCQVAPSAYLLDMPGIARFLVDDGSRVRGDLADGAPLADVCSFLLGSIFGALCHQNHLLPLHASAVETGGRVTAFLGNSGAGKSTLAACLKARGRRIVSDDICLLEDGADGLQVVPVAGWVKLWRQSLAHLGEQAEERNRVFVADDKYRLYVPADGPDRPVLANVVVLARGEAGEQARIEPLPAVEAIAALMEMTYLAYVVELTGQREALFHRCARVMRGAKAYRLTVPWGLKQMDAVLDLLQAQLLQE